MKIEGDRQQPAINPSITPGVTDRASTPAETAGAVGKDTVALSPDAELFAAAAREAQAPAPVREALVEKMRAEIAERGSLDVDPNQLADLLIDDLLND